MTRRDWMASALPLLAPSMGSPGMSPPSHADNAAGDALVVDSLSRKPLFQQGDSRHATLPGATLEPFVLAALLDQRLLKPGERLECPGGFRLRSRNLECIHAGNSGPFDAVDALAVSCNFWFAVMARRLGADGLLKALRKAGLTAQHAPSDEQVCLQALGLAHVAASPWTLARAYGDLLRAGPPELVMQGMRAAVERGTGRVASSTIAWIAAKTGTAPGGLPGTSEGWFAGWAWPGAQSACPDADSLTCLRSRPGVVFAVRVAGGTGRGAAAELGKQLAERWVRAGG